MASAAAVLSAQDAHAYVGRKFWKFFSETRAWYQGIVQGIDTAIENEYGEINEGISFRVLYPRDGGQEHISCPELARLLESPQQWTGKKRSNSNLLSVSPAGTAAIEGDSSAFEAQYQCQRDSKRRRCSSDQNRPHHQQSQQQPQGEQEDAEQELPDKSRQCGSWGGAADEGTFEGAAAERSGAARGTARGGKHKRTAAAQRQPQPASDTSNSGMDKAVRCHSLQQQMPRDSAAAEDGHSPALHSSEDDELSEDAEGARGAEDAEKESQEPDADMTERLLKEAINQVVTVRTTGLAGQLKQVQVQNFLNPPELYHGVQPTSYCRSACSPHVNVIGGKNGSGKSATLLAMQCCLGARAHATGRGESIKPFILTGAREATLKVSLWNTGEDAYQPEGFGDYLTVERVIRLSGAQQKPVTKWRLLDHAGRKVSENKKAIDDMLDHLSVSAANPLAVMTQDTSRNFLSGTFADQKKYELFMEATCLADMQGKLDKFQRLADEMQFIIKDIKADHNKRQQKMLEVKEKLKKLESSAGLRDQRQMYERAAMWAAVEHLQAMLQKHTEVEQVKGPERLQAVLARLDEINRKLGLARRREEQLNAANADLQDNQDSFAAQSHSVAEQLKQARLEHRRKDKAFKTIASQLKAVQDEMQQLMSETAQESMDDCQMDLNQRLERHQQELSCAQQELDQAEHQLQQQEQQEQQVAAARLEKEQQIRQLRNNLEALQVNIQSNRQELRELQAAKNQKLAVFGQHAQLRAAVDKQRQLFEHTYWANGQHLPIGPIGAHLSLTQEVWVVAAEVVLGPHLEKWIVHNEQDHKALLQLARSLHMRDPVVLVSSFDRPLAAYKIWPNQKLQAGWQGLRQFVTIEHPEHAHIIDNKLMDMAHYDIVVVDQDESRCKALLYELNTHLAGVEVSLAVHASGIRWAKKGETVRTINYFADRRPRVSTSEGSSVSTLQQLVQDQQAQLNVLQQQRTGTS